MSDSCPSASLPRKRFIKQLKKQKRHYEAKNNPPDDENLKNVVEIKCQAHSTALVESRVLKELQLTSLVDKISTTFGNVSLKDSLFKLRFERLRS